MSQTASNSLPGQARVVIVGGGMMGAGLLYHLAEEGWKDVLLVEKGELTSGSTWHAAGQCPSFIADYNMAKIHDYGNRLYPKLEAMTGQYVSWHGCGGIRLARTQEELDWFHHVAGVGKLIGFHCEIIDPAKIKQLNPWITLDGVIAGAWTTDDGHVDPAGCCNALAIGAKKMGAQISIHNRVLDIKQRPDDSWQVITEQGSVDCEHVVNAAGCYARQVSQMVGTDSPITNMKHTYIVTESVPEFLERDDEMAVVRDPWPSAYYRQEQKSALIGIYETANSEECWTHRGGWPEWESENELFDPDFDNIAPYIERVMQRMPNWAELGLKRVVCGAIPHTPDANPLLGPAHGVKNFWQCNGASIGIAAGAGCGKYLAQWMVHGDAEINMAGLDPRRFGQHAPGDFTKARSHQDYEHMYVLHLPGEERPASRQTRVSSLYDTLVAKGAQMTDVNGWERAKWFSASGETEVPSLKRNNSFAAVAEECKAVRERVGVLDLSTFAVYEVAGSNAENYLNRICANKIATRAGGITLAHYLSGSGRIQGESTITRMADDRFLVLSGAFAEDRDLDWLVQNTSPDEKVRIKNLTNGWGTLVVAGPKARETLAPICDVSLENAEFPWLTAQEVTIAGEKVWALRVNYAGELGWELHAPMASLSQVYAEVCKAGEALGIADFGSYALNSLRMEKAYKGWGAELTNEIGMVEADLMRFFAANKADFVGKAATEVVQKIGGEIGLIYFSVDGAEVDVHGGEAIFANGKPVGVTTSGGYGHATGLNLGFAYVDTPLADGNTPMEIELLGGRFAIKVLKKPAWDPASKRSRA